MPSCRYCGREFDDDEARDRHLRDEHRDELGPIDRRRIQGTDDDGGRFDVEPGVLALAGVLGIATAVVMYVVFFAGGGSSGVPDQVAQTPTGVGEAHFHGTMNVTIDGTAVDSSDPAYVNPGEYPAFHFDGVDDPQWHGHANGITLEYAMATFGIEVAADEVTFERRTYHGDDPGTTVAVEVNGEPVDPRTYEIQEGDHVYVYVGTSE